MIDAGRRLTQVNVAARPPRSLLPMTDDASLRRRVVDALAFEPSVDAANIGVSARQGVVTLFGHVASCVEKMAAERAALQVKGVLGVAQELKVRLPSDKRIADDEIAARAVRLLRWDAAIPADRIWVRVEHGILTLSGNVDWHFQRVDAEYQLRKLSGVRGVVNEIAVTPKPRTADVRAKILAALERHTNAEPNCIDVDVSAGRVMLSGKVRAWTERDVVERAAWSVAGVTRVDNRIRLAED